MMEVLKISFDLLEDKSITDYCRFLLTKGFNPKLRLEVWREGESEYALLVREIGKWAKWKLVESPIVDIHLTQYKAHPKYPPKFPTGWHSLLAPSDRTAIILDAPLP